MKKILFFSAVALSLFVGCEKSNELKPEATNNDAALLIESASAAITTTLPVEGQSDCVGPYKVILESVTNNGNGTYSWVWSVQNPNPGNGSNGTFQNLSHWDITLGSCVTFDNVISGATSSNNVTVIIKLRDNRPNPSCKAVARSNRCKNSRRVHNWLRKPYKQAPNNSTLMIDLASSTNAFMLNIRANPVSGFNLLNLGPSKLPEKIKPPGMAPIIHIARNNNNKKNGFSVRCLRD